MKKNARRTAPSTEKSRDFHEAIRLFREVGVLANTALRASLINPMEESDPDDLQGQIKLMKFLIDRIGWVADVGLRALGDHGNFARAEDWMLPAD